MTQTLFNNTHRLKRVRPNSTVVARPPSFRSAEEPNKDQSRVECLGKFFACGGHPWVLKGITYGPFAPGVQGDHLPQLAQLRLDLAQIRKMGSNALRVYHVPPRWLLDEAIEQGLRVMIDVPWEKHRCFFEDWSARADAYQRVRAAAADLGDHPGVFAISVANEFPSDVARFYGARKLERFVDELIDVVKQTAPTCLATFTNYPPTEFLSPAAVDFHCFNVYLHDPTALGAYLDRLQHIAGPQPLVLGEYGVDSLRQGEQPQARLAAEHLRRVFRHGLAGSFVFSFTDEWFTGGHRVEDWAFGLTTADRREKLAADAVRQVWAEAPAGLLPGKPDAPKVSVIVCSYNGAATLPECLSALDRLEYPSYEVVLVDDGSTDETPAIAAEFPAVRYLHQENKGLSVARNVGAESATGDVVAYTDSDCVPHPRWLCYLIQAMRDQQVDAVGGPNLPPPSDSWIARCVAASPGSPSHVMVDDRRAEHVPGCNMAFRRDALLALGGFDPQFRQAGDDVDICWRIIDSGKTIGYAAAALVWHHRRGTILGYLRQQKGYGRSEAMLRFKHPQRFSAMGFAQWTGVIYGEGAVGVPVLRPAVYHGRFGSGLFQTIYRTNSYSRWAYPVLLEWHLLVLLVAAVGALLWPGLLLAAVLWGLTLAAAVRTTWLAPLADGAPCWCRPLVFWMHLAQPVVRAWHRYAHRFGRQRLPATAKPELLRLLHRPAAGVRDLYWRSGNGVGREHLLAQLVSRSHDEGWTGRFGDDWASWDVYLDGDPWHDIIVRTATEDLGGPRRFTRARLTLRLAGLTIVTAAAVTIGLAAAVASGRPEAITAACGAAMAFTTVWLRSRHRCRRAAAGLLARAGQVAGLRPVEVGAEAGAERGQASEVRAEAPPSCRDAEPATG